MNTNTPTTPNEPRKQGIQKRSTEQLRQDLSIAEARMDRARNDYEDMCSCGEGVGAWFQRIFSSPPLMKNTVMGRVIDECYGEIREIEDELARRENSPTSMPPSEDPELTKLLNLIKRAKEKLEELRGSPTGTQTEICEVHSGMLSLSDMTSIAAGLNNCSLKFAGRVGIGATAVGYVMELGTCPNGDVIILASSGGMARFSHEQITNRRDSYESVGQEDLTGNYAAGVRNDVITDINRLTRQGKIGN